MSAMKRFAGKVGRFLLSDDGPTSVEYAVMLVLIVAVAAMPVSCTGRMSQTVFNNVAKALGIH
jgi:pilus assembly protein Flp/PilA